MSITGARTSIRRPMASIMVMALTSLVMRVIREAEEKRSISAKENSCTLSNRHWRRLPPKPWLAKAAYLAASTPQAMEKPASTSINAPSWKIYPVSPEGMATSTISAMTRGRRSSQMTSKMIRIGDLMASFLYPSKWVKNRESKVIITPLVENQEDCIASAAETEPAADIPPQKSRTTCGRPPAETPPGSRIPPVRPCR